MRRFERDDERFRRIAHLLPGDPGVTAKDNKLFLDAVRLIARTGAPWPDLPARFGKYDTALQRFNRWAKKGDLGPDHGSPRRRRRPGESAHRFHCGPHPPPCRRRPKKSGEQALGRSRGGLTTKLHLTADALGNPVRLILAGGQAHDRSQARALIEVLKCEHIIADKGCASGPFVATIEEAGAKAVIPSRSNRREPRELDAHLYRERNQVERLFGRLKECRRVATRYEKTARNDLAFCHLASVMVLLARLSVEPGNPRVPRVTSCPNT